MSRDEVINKLSKLCDDLDDNCPVFLFDALDYLKDQQEIVRCKDCKYYKIEECWEDMGYGVKMKAGRYEAICTNWANGTDSDGYCFRAELLN